jgi:hypothetical protein
MLLGGEDGGGAPIHEKEFHIPAWVTQFLLQPRERQSVDFEDSPMEARLDLAIWTSLASEPPQLECFFGSREWDIVQRKRFVED